MRRVLARSHHGAVLAGLLAIILAAAAGVFACARPATPQSAEEQIARAVLPAPESLRESATVLAYRDGRLETLRRGEGPLVCLADDPSKEAFHVACYHRSLEPYMARGRELTAQGLSDRDALARRWEEIRAGTLEMPDGPTVLYSLSDPEGKGTGAREPEKLRRLTVLYVPYATAEEAGLPTDPKDGVPWLMFPGQPTAHVMIHD